MQFSLAGWDGSVTVGFAGPDLDAKFNPNMITLPFDTVYRPAPASVAPNRKIVRDAKRFCFFGNGQKLEKATEISCVGGFVQSGQKTAFNINFTIKRVMKRNVDQ